MNEINTVRASLDGADITAVEFKGLKYLYFRRRYEKFPVWNIHIETGLPITHHWAPIDGRRVPRAVREFAKRCDIWYA